MDDKLVVVMIEEALYYNTLCNFAIEENKSMIKSQKGRYWGSSSIPKSHDVEIFFKDNDLVYKTHQNFGTQPLYRITDKGMELYNFIRPIMKL